MQRRVFGKWTGEDLERVVGAIQRGDFSLCEASKMYGVSKGTLSRHLSGKNKIAKTFDADMEKELVQHCLSL